MNKVIELFKDWHQATFNVKADFKDDSTLSLLAAFQAGYQARTFTTRSPVQVRQTPTSAINIARQLREGLENKQLDESTEDLTVNAPEGCGKQIMEHIQRELRRNGSHQR